MTDVRRTTRTAGRPAAADRPVRDPHPAAAPPAIRTVAE
ncbi:hypothetical protein K530_48335 [Streptomyces noursei CCRC 11814]|nr:hypothetical protein K530_48335 [Streptomyces noursei CCRC 11814]